MGDNFAITAEAIYNPPIPLKPLIMIVNSTLHAKLVTSGSKSGKDLNPRGIGAAGPHLKYLTHILFHSFPGEGVDPYKPPRYIIVKFTKNYIFSGMQFIK
ncbi:MAG: hypothetical protein QXR45_08735 [Candidatus Bathyarchaeia archaeon]